MDINSCHNWNNKHVNCITHGEDIRLNWWCGSSCGGGCDDGGYCGISGDGGGSSGDSGGCYCGSGGDRSSDIGGFGVVIMVEWWMMVVERVSFYKQHEKFIKLTRHLAGKNPSF